MGPSPCFACQLQNCCMHVGRRLETEGHDRSDINLPGDQLQLLQDATDSVTSESSIIIMICSTLNKGCTSSKSHKVIYGSTIMYFELNFTSCFTINM